MATGIKINNAFNNFFFAAATFIFCTANARKIPGQIVDKQGNTIDVIFNITGAMTGGLAYSLGNYILQKGQEELMQPRGLGFKKNMVAYLQDCPTVATMVEEKQLRKADMEIIVQEHNVRCAD